MNVELLQRVAAKAREFPHSFDMGCWLKPTDQTPEHPCGTIGCIAGNVLLLSGKAVRIVEPSFISIKFLASIGNVIQARDLLQITSQQAANLFYATNWPGFFQERLHEEPEGIIVADRIDHFIATGE